MSRSATGSTDTGRSGAVARKQRRGGPGKNPQPSMLREGLKITGSILGVLLGLLMLGICLGAWYVSNMAVEILDEIGARDVSGPRAQVEQYGDFFDGLDSQLFIVRQDEPRNLQNVITYLWTVEHRQSGEVTQFRWEWDMSTLDVVPRSNGALLLDRRLKFANDSDLQDYDFYDPDDSFAMAIVTQDVSLIGLDDISSGWENPSYTEGVLPPRISPDDARGRASAHAARKKKELEEQLDNPCAGESSTSEGNAGESSGIAEPEVHLPSNHPANPPVRDDV